MIVSCTSCGTEYRIDDSKIPATGGVVSRRYSQTWLTAASTPPTPHTSRQSGQPTGIPGGAAPAVLLVYLV